MSEANGGKRKHPYDDQETGEVQKKLKSQTNLKAGVLLFSGLTDYEDRNDAKLSKLPSIKWSPHRFTSLEGVCIRDVSTGPVSYFFYAISDKGKVYACGLNQKGQLGMGDNKNRNNPTLIESLSEYNIVSVATGRSHGLFLTDDGEVFACGDNTCGQCGIGNKKESVTEPTRIDYTGSPVVQIACGAEFSLILTGDGEIFSFGYPIYGQLGHGSENKELAKANKITYHCEYSPKPVVTFVEIDPDVKDIISHGQPKITKIACGVNHSTAIDDQQRLFTWGFGGYGRLGHNTTKDEHVPRLLKCWHRITGRADGGITHVYCGQQFTLVQTTAAKCTLLFGCTKLSGEANMYPKMVDDLQGWNVRSIVCNQQGWIACADDKVIATQPSPCYGTMALGEKQKSSAAPKIVSTLDKVYCIKAGIGYMHSLYIVRDESEKDKNAINSFPTMTIEDTLEKPVEISKPQKGKAKTKSTRGKKKK